MILGEVLGGLGPYGSFSFVQLPETRCQETGRPECFLEWIVIDFQMVLCVCHSPLASPWPSPGAPLAWKQVRSCFNKILEGPQGGIGRSCACKGLSNRLYKTLEWLISSLRSSQDSQKSPPRLLRVLGESWGSLGMILGEVLGELRALWQFLIRSIARNTPSGDWQARMLSGMDCHCFPNGFMRFS